MKISYREIHVTAQKRGDHVLSHEAQRENEKKHYVSEQGEAIGRR